MYIKCASTLTFEHYFQVANSLHRAPLSTSPNLEVIPCVDVCVCVCVCVCVMCATYDDRQRSGSITRYLASLSTVISSSSFWPIGHSWPRK
jgi:hypothetical protein